MVQHPLPWFAIQESVDNCVLYSVDVENYDDHSCHSLVLWLRCSSLMVVRLGLDYTACTCSAIGVLLLVKQAQKGGHY